MDNKASTPFDRLLLLRQWLQENDSRCRNSESAILRKMGLGVGYFSTSEKQANKSLRESTYKKVKKAWPQVNIEWLRTGEGKMFCEPVPTGGEPVGGVPFYDADFQNRFCESAGSPDIAPAYFIDFKPFNRKGNVWCEMSGDSMSPRINGGDKICLRPLKSVEDIVFGEIYAIVTKDGLRTVRWVTRSPVEGMLRLIPENKDPRFGDYQDMAMSDVLTVAKVVGAIRSF